MQDFRRHKYDFLQESVVHFKIIDKITTKRPDNGCAIVFSDKSRQSVLLSLENQAMVYRSGN